MPTFTYEALDPKGQVIEGVMESSSVDSVIEELRSIHYTVIHVHEKRDYLSSMRESFYKAQGINYYALAIFTRQFATIFNAGLPLMRGLEALASQTINPQLTLVLRQVADDIRAGFSLTRAMQKHPRIFSPVYIALVRAGEMAGALGEILDRLAVMMERNYSLRAKVKSALTYPAFIFMICLGITIFLVTYIFPSFVSLLEGLDMQLPWPTLILIHVTNALKNWVVLSFFGVILILGGFLFKQYVSTPLGRRQLDRFLLEFPVLGTVNKKASLSYFCRTLGTLLGSGVPVVHALDVVGKVSGNEIIGDIIEEVKLSLKGGERLSEPIKQYELFPPMVSQLISVGEETGNLPLLLEKLADYFDQEVETALQSFVAMIEPLMIFFMGGLVGFVLVAVFMPVYSILSKF